MINKKEMTKIAIGSIVAVVTSAVIFSGASLGVKALEVGKNEVVETNYNNLDHGLTNDQVPADYEQPNYEVQLVGIDQPTKNDIKIEEAAELVSQHIWRIFRENLHGQTLEIEYESARKWQPRATWRATVQVDEDLSYNVVLDAVTGESYWIGKNAYYQANIREGLNKELLENHEEYQQIAEELIKKHQLLSTDIKTIEYVSQGFEKNEIDNKNSTITFEARSVDDQKVQLTISTYNQELLSIGYDGWLEMAKRFEQRLKKNDTKPFNITDELMKEVEETNIPVIISE